MNKHTPGPWHFNADLSAHDTRLVYGLDGALVADCGRIYKRTLEEATANARLIAAAPDMLELLDNWASVLADNISLNIQPGSAAHVALLELIKKTRGE
jgi:hypothetical protein